MLPMGRLDCVPFVCWDRNSFHLEPLFMHRGRLNSINQHSFFFVNVNKFKYHSILHTRLFAEVALFFYSYIYIDIDDFLYFCDTTCC